MMKVKHKKRWRKVLLILFLMFIAIIIGALKFSPLKVILIKPTQTLSKEVRLNGFSKLWDTVNNHFVYFHQVPELNWDKIFKEYKPKVIAAQTVEAYYNVLHKMISQLHDGHTMILSPLFFNPFYRAILPIQLKDIGGRTVITKVDKDDSEIQDSGLQPGMEIISVNGKSIADTLQKIMKYISASTPQALKLSSYKNLLMGAYGTRVTLKVIDLKGNKRSVNLSRHFNFHEIKCYFGFMCKVVQSHYLGKEIGYIRIRNFRKQNVVEKFDQALSKLMNTKGLILDLRNNGGGNSGSSYDVAGRFISKTIPGFKIIADKTGDNKESDLPISTYIEPRNTPYLKPVVILVNAGSESATEDVLVGLQYSKRAVIVGETTNGSTGESIPIRLPSHGIAFICARECVFPNDKPYVGVGIIPNIIVHPTIAGIISGKDEILDKGIETIEKLIAKSQYSKILKK